MKTKNKLELNWVGKYDRKKIEPRILKEIKEKNYGDEKSENILIHGDNLLALKSLVSNYANAVNFIYIDPPYNTGKAFEYYDDNIEHSIWLSLMKERLCLLHELLSDDGFFCCQIDDSESHYLKVLLDEIFGRSNYLTTLYIKVRYAEKTLKQDMKFHKEIEHIFVYRKSPKAKPNLPFKEGSYDKYNYYIQELGEGREIELGGKKVIVFDKNEYKIKTGEGSSLGLKEIWASGTILDGNSSGRFFRDYLDGRADEDGLGVLYKVYGIGDDRFDYRYFTGPKKASATKGKYYQGVPLSKLDEDFKENIPIKSYYDFSAEFGNCRQEGNAPFRGGKKPEKLIMMLMEYFSKPGDLFLDSFLGSGSTIATAHKMNRKWIGIEMGNQIYELDIPRMNSIIDGDDSSGITKIVNWNGGGGYKFYELAPSLLNKDSFGNWIISPEYDADMLSEAMAIHNGFKYIRNQEVFYKQGYSSENDFIFTTTNYLTEQYLDMIHDTMKKGETLLICCKTFQEECINKYSNITIEKIPQSMLKKYEFGVADYTLNINNVDDEEEDVYE